MQFIELLCRYHKIFFIRIMFLRQDCILEQLPCRLLLWLLPSTGIAMAVVILNMGVAYSESGEFVQF